MKLIIAGTRTFADYDLLKNKAKALTANVTVKEVVSGGNGYLAPNGEVERGADLLGEKWANDNNIKITRFMPNWSLYGKMAGPIRNGKMAEYGDALIAFWDGKSKGTESMIALAKLGGLKVRVIKY